MILDIKRFGPAGKSPQQRAGGLFTWSVPGGSTRLLVEMPGKGRGNITERVDPNSYVVQRYSALQVHIVLNGRVPVGGRVVAG